MDTASKNVQFVLQAVVDPGARATVLSFATELKRAQESLKGFTEATVASLANANKEVTETLHELAAAREVVSKAGADRIAKIEDNLAQFIASRSEQATQAVLSDIDRRLRAEEEANRRLRDLPPPTPPTPPTPPSTDPEQRERERLAEAYEDANLRIIKSESSVAVSVTKSTGMSAEAYESLQGQIRNMRRELFATAAEATGSIMQVTRGFMNLGLVAESDLEKVAKGMIKVQSMFDIVSGGTRVLLSLEKVMHLYRTSTQMAAVAQEGLNASMLRGQAIGNVGLGGALAGAASGALGRARALFTTRAAVDAANAANATQALREAAMLGTSGAATVAPAAAPVAARAGFLAPTLGGATLSTAGIVGVGVGAAVGAGFGGMSIYDGIRQARQSGIGGGAAPGSWTDRIGGNRWNPFNQALALDENLRADAQTKKQDKRQKRADAYIEQANADFERMDAKGPALAAAMQQARDASSQMFHQSLETMKTDEQRAVVISRLAKTEKESAQLKAEHATIEDRFTQLKVINENAYRSSLNEQIDLVRTRIELERQAADAKKSALQVELSEEREVLSILETQAKMAKDQLLSAKERFAMMSEPDQATVKQLADKLQRGQQMSAEELGKLSSFRELGGVKDAFDRELERRAKAGGFDAAFGDKASKAVRDAEEAARGPRAVVANIESQINVTIDADLKKQTDALTKVVGDKLKQLQDQITTSVNKLEVEVTDIKQRIQNRAGP